MSRYLPGTNQLLEIAGRPDLRTQAPHSRSVQTYRPDQSEGGSSEDMGTGGVRGVEELKQTLVERVMRLFW